MRKGDNECRAELTKFYQGRSKLNIVEIIWEYGEGTVRYISQRLED